MVMFWLLMKDGTTVGSIGTLSGHLTIGNTDTGIIFQDGEDNIQPLNLTTNSARDAAIDLGKSTNRFKDLYLSGGVYVGGTAAANKLDDYEEGTWTPVLTAVLGTPTVSYLTQTGTYVKIGDTLTLFVSIRINTISGGSGNVRITGLPFTNAAYGAYKNPAGIATAQVLTTSQAGPVLLYAEDGSASLQGRLP